MNEKQSTSETKENSSSFLRFVVRVFFFEFGFSHRIASGQSIQFHSPLTLSAKRLLLRGWNQGPWLCVAIRVDSVDPFAVAPVFTRIVACATGSAIGSEAQGRRNGEGIGAAGRRRRGRRGRRPAVVSGVGVAVPAADGLPAQDLPAGADADLPGRVGRPVAAGHHPPRRQRGPPFRYSHH